MFESKIAHFPTETLSNILSQIGRNGVNLDYHRLLQAAMVCRVWSTIAVPLLWACPLKQFTTNKDSAVAQITTLVKCLSTEARDAIADCGVKLPECGTKAPTFAYAKFAKQITDHHLYDAVQHWVHRQQRTGQVEDDVIVQEVVARILELFVKENARIGSLNLTQNCGYSKDSAKSLARIGITRILVQAVEQLSVNGEISQEALVFYARACTAVKRIQVITPCPQNEGIVTLVEANPKVVKMQFTGCEESSRPTYVNQMAKMIELTTGNLRSLHIEFGNSDDRYNLSKVYKAIAEHCPNLVKLRIPSSKRTASLLPELLQKCTKLENVTILNDDDDDDDCDDNDRFINGGNDYEMEVADYLSEMSTVMPRRMRRFILLKTDVDDEDLMEFLEKVESRVEVRPMGLHFSNIEELLHIAQSFEDEGVIQSIFPDDLPKFGIMEESRSVHVMDGH